MKRIIGLLCFLTILVISAGTAGMAASAATFQSSVTVNQKEIRENEEIEAILSFDKFSDTKKGINVFKGTLNYDSNIFEPLSTADFEPLSGWENFLFNPRTNEFIAIHKAGQTQKDNVLKVKLKVKKGVIAGQANIGVDNLAVSEGKKDIEVKPLPAKLEVIEKPSEKPVLPPIDNQGNVTVDGSVNKENMSHNGQRTSKAEKAPSRDGKKEEKTGDKKEEDTKDKTEDKKEDKREDKAEAGGEKKSKSQPDKDEMVVRQSMRRNISVAVLIVLLIILVVSLYLWRKKKGIKSLKDDKKMLVLLIFILSMASLQLGEIVYAAERKGALDNYNELNYADVTVLQQHLIHLKAIPEHLLENADMNSDGKLTVADVSVMVQKIEDTLDYEVSIFPKLDSYYTEKGNTVEVKFRADISHNAKITEVTLNRKQYAVKALNNNDEYSVEIPGYDKAGIYDLEISQVKLNIGKVVKTKFHEKVEVLKEIPEMKDYEVKDLINEGKVQILFNIEDSDRAVSEGNIRIVTKEGQGVVSHKVTSGENSFDIEVEEDKDYKAIIEVLYNRDSDKLVDQEVDNTGKFIVEKDIKLVVDYQFVLNNAALYDKDNNEKTVFEKREKVILGFESKNATAFVPERAVVNGESYPVEKSEEKYTIHLRAPEKAGKKELKIEQIQLSNGKILDIKKGNKVKITVLKSMPSISEVIMEENVKDDKMAVSFHTEDGDGALKKLQVVLYDASDKVIFKKEVTGDRYTKEIPLGNRLTPSYRLKVFGDYNLHVEGGEDVTNTELYAQNKEAIGRAIVESSSMSKEYLEKGETLELTYTIKSNRESEIEKIIVNNLEVLVTKEGEAQYKAAVEVGRTAGKQDIVLSSILFADGESVKVHKTDNIEILKDKPAINDFRSEDDYANRRMKFSFDMADIDGAFISGKVQLVKVSDGSIWKEQEITGAGQYEVTFDVVENTEYNFKVILTYKRDEDSSQIVKNKEALKNPVELIVDYNLSVENLEAYDKNNIKTAYFDRDTKIKLRFTSTNDTRFTPEKAVINDEEYDLTHVNGNVYEAMVSGFGSGGVKEIRIDKIILNNTKELAVSKDNKMRVEILKLKPTTADFGYEELANGKIRVSFRITDDEQAVTSSKAAVSDGTNKIFEKEGLDIGVNSFEFDTNHSESYTIEVMSDYDLDTNTLDSGSNVFTNVGILDENVGFSQELIELKDIESGILYQKQGDNVVKVSELDTSNFTPQDYIVQVEMKDMPDFYAEINSGRIVDDEFMLELKYDHGVSYQGSVKSNAIMLSYGKVEDGIAKQVHFEDLINTIQQNPAAEITLTQDLDAREVNNANGSGTMINVEFQGTLNANGYTIKNLKKPLFNSINGGTIENLIIEDADVRSVKGILSNTMNNTQIRDVHIRNSNLYADHTTGTGALVGVSAGTSSIEKSSVSNTKVRSGKRTGGIVGFAKDNFTIKNSYIDGQVTVTSDAAGGMLGQIAGSATIENCYANITLNVDGDWAHGGMTGYSDGATVVLKNSISLADGSKGKRVIGSGSVRATNNYEISESKLVSNASVSGITSVSKADINDEFLKERLNWSTDIWNISKNNAQNMPRLKGLDSGGFGQGDKPVIKPDNPDVYIPNIERLRKLSGYDTKKEIAYHNMFMLMPFLDAKLYVDYGNKINGTDPLNTIKIKSVLPYGANGKLMAGVDSETQNAITSIKVIFENEQVQNYDVTFYKMLSDVATYKIESLGVGYNYNKFILNTGISLVDEIADRAAAMDYNTDIAAVTPEKESRLYTDYYNESVKNRLKEVIKKILGGQADYNIYLDNDILKTKVKNELFQNQTMEKILYTYNYYDKWYNMEMGGSRLSDVIFFDVSNGVNKKYEIRNIVSNTLSQSESVRRTRDTVTFYNNVIKPQTKNLSIKAFLEYYIKVLAGYTSSEDWFTDNFKGILTEKSVTGKENEIHYRGWTLLNKRNNYLLPILSAPQESMYMISVPSQVMIGSMNRYNQYVSGNIEGMRQLIEQYATKIKNFYTTSSTFIDSAVTRLNARTHMQMDTRFNFPGSGNQYEGRTQDPVIKWVYEAVGCFSLDNGTPVYADGTDVYWVEYEALGDDFWFALFTHETAHNQEGGYFYEGNGRRRGTWAEDHADGNIAQELGDGSFVFNLRGDMDIKSDSSTNLTMARINSKDKIHSYYREMFETYYVLDYLTAQAFLKLTPEQQARLATQANYMDTNGQAGAGTRYSALQAQDFRQMNLQTMEDLWDNRITFRGTGTVGVNSYGGDNHYNIYWYQPHNDRERPDANSFKRLGFEMLGVGGYTNGYVAQRSTVSENDLQALRTATGDPNNTWKQYKMERFDNVRVNLPGIPYFDVDQAVEVYRKAMVKDAQAGNRGQTNNVRRVLYGIVKRATNDFENGTVYNLPAVMEVSTAEELIRGITENPVGNYKLTADLDFSGIDVTGQTSYIAETFLGTLDGAGFAMTGMTRPLFQKVVYANIRSINVESPIYPSNTKGLLTESTKNSMVENVKVTDTNIIVPIGGVVSGALLQSGNIEITQVQNVTSSVEDMAKIAEDETSAANESNTETVTDNFE